MINNESLFDLYVGRRRNGWRNAFSAPRWATVAVTPAQSVTAVFLTAHGQPEPPERITETDVHDDSAYDQCGDCGDYDYAAMLHNGVCSACEHANWQDWQDTIAAVGREEYAMRGGREL